MALFLGAAEQLKAGYLFFHLCMGVRELDQAAESRGERQGGWAKGMRLRGEGAKAVGQGSVAGANES